MPSNKYYHKYKKYKAKYLKIRAENITSSNQNKYSTLKEYSLFDSYVPNYNNNTICVDGDCDEYDEYNDFSDTDNSQLISQSRISTSEGDKTFFKIVNLSKIDKKELSTSLKPNKFNILHIKTVEKFDRFTNTYGYLDDNNAIRINWPKVADDFKGVYLSSNDDLRLNRFEKALFKEKMYESCPATPIG